MRIISQLDLRDLAEDKDLEIKRGLGREGMGERPQRFFESYSAMANSYGGVVFPGIEEISRGRSNVSGTADLPEPGLFEDRPGTAGEEGFASGSGDSEHTEHSSEHKVESSEHYGPDSRAPVRDRSNLAMLRLDRPM